MVNEVAQDVGEQKTDIPPSEQFQPNAPQLRKPTPPKPAYMSDIYHISSGMGYTLHDLGLKTPNVRLCEEKSKLIEEKLW